MPRSKRSEERDIAPILESRSMRDLDRILRAIAPKDVIVSLIGESGTGKEVLARRIHQLSPRCAAPFIPINCAAIPDALFESELFGHERGAFTSASDRAKGKLEAAAGGTLFLDEIGEMPLTMQAKLLRFLENRKFMRVGGTTKISVDARLVCATLKPLEEEVRAGRFRADLHYRIQGIPLRIPPLRERGADIGPLIQVLTAELATKHGTLPPKYSRQAMQALRSFTWPGNVRELRNVIELLCLLRDGRSVRVRDLPAALRPSNNAPTSDLALTETLEIDVNQPLDDIIEQVLGRALQLEDGNRSRAALRLSVSLRTMQRFAARSSGKVSRKHRP